jgi:hypothetical protein
MPVSQSRLTRTLTCCRTCSNALRSGWFDRVYEDGDCSVLHIRDQKSEPPPEEKNDNTDGGDNKNDNSPP